MSKLCLYGFAMLIFFGCTQKKDIPMKNIPKKQINTNLPTVGIVIFEGVIVNEVVATSDVFGNPDTKGKKLFNVVTLAKEDKVLNTANGLKISADFTFDEVPELDVLVVPSSYNTAEITADQALVNFVKEQNEKTEYTASHCSGAFIIGESGVADHKKIVTYVTGGKLLQKDYPNLKVADDSKVAVVEDGKFISSNGSLVAYLASLNLLEKLTSLEHRKYVEEFILLNRLQEN